MRRMHLGLALIIATFVVAPRAAFAQVEDDGAISDDGDLGDLAGPEGGEGEAPAEGTPTEGTPSEGTPSEGTPSEGTPAEGTPTEPPPAEGALVEGGELEPAPPAEVTPLAVEAQTPPPEEPPPEEEPADDFTDRWVTIGLRAGLYIPSIANRMDPHADLTLEVGVLLPFLDRMFTVLADLSWAPPGRAQELNDPRLGEAGAPYTYSMETHHLMISAGVLFRILPPGSFFVPYVSAVGRVYLLETRVSGESGGEPFGENIERSTQGGFAVAAGGELRLGPGAALLELSFGYADLPHRITGATSAASLAIQLGYRLFL